MNESNHKPIKILIVDDDPLTVKVASAVLGVAGYSVFSSPDGFTALSEIERIEPQLVLLDWNMPGLDGLATLAGLRQRAEYISVIFLTGKSGTEALVAGLDAGADDYLCKPYDPRELVARVKVQLRLKALRDELNSANAKLQDLVDIDDLTGLYNMRSIFGRIENELSRSHRYQRPLALIMLDMDKFKSVNDEHDHLFGSFVLKGVGALIKKNLRKTDFAARYGGDEYLIVLSETDEVGARVFAERLRAEIARFRFAKDTNAKFLTASLGVAVTDPDLQEVDAQSLVRAADHALYRSKAKGRNCVHIFSYHSQKTQLIEKDHPENAKRNPRQSPVV